MARHHTCRNSSQSTGSPQLPIRLRRNWRSLLLISLIGFSITTLMGVGCPTKVGLTNSGNYKNTTDPTNGGASYIGSDACRSCHPDYAEKHAGHGHANALFAIQGAAPTYSPVGTRAGVPNPPDGFAWTDISYVLGGYLKTARFLDSDGYQLTTGLTGKPTQWLLSLPPVGITPQFAEYKSTATGPTSFSSSCINCHTTGGMPVDASNPMNQENRPGISGTWQEPGAQCEACHGPGSNHIPSTYARANFVDLDGSQSCGPCHGKPKDADFGDVSVSNGFISHNQQWDELHASGGHSSFACGYCHDPHVSTVYDRDQGLRNQCTACHGDQNMALHKGKVFTRGDYTEVLTCESCHMPFAALVANPAPASAVGELAHIGDTRSHVFRISDAQADFHACISADGSKLLLDSQGRAALTADFVCLRCHNPVSLPTLSFTPARAGEIACCVHDETELNQKRIRELAHQP